MCFAWFRVCNNGTGNLQISVKTNKTFVNFIFNILLFCVILVTYICSFYTDNWFPFISGFRLVIHNLAEENYEDVISNCNVEIERCGPDVPEAYLVRGTFKLLQGQIEDSLLDLNHLLSLESVDVKVSIKIYYSVYMCVYLYI